MAETNRFQRTGTPEVNDQRAEFPLVLRGYDRGAVDAYVEEMTRLVHDLEGTQLRENVVQRALDEVGEQTASILQRAHETAEEITARSRAKAEGRLQRAEREAEIVRRDADEYAERIVTDTRALWEERQRLLEDLRQLADEVLGNADDATERLPEPGVLGRMEAELPDATVQLHAVEGLLDDELPEQGLAQEPEPAELADAEQPLPEEADLSVEAETEQPLPEQELVQETEQPAGEDPPTAEFELPAEDEPDSEHSEPR